jgi:hypothetical protein
MYSKIVPVMGSGNPFTGVIFVGFLHGPVARDLGRAGEVVIDLYEGIV